MLVPGHEEEEEEEEGEEEEEEEEEGIEEAEEEEGEEGEEEGGIKVNDTGYRKAVMTASGENDRSSTVGIRCEGSLMSPVHGNSR